MTCNMRSMRTAFVLFLTLVWLLAVLPATTLAQDADLFAADQLDNLLAPIALYPDPLLAQVLLAATFPDQIDEAARYLRGGGDPNSIEAQSWDVSVKAVAHYPQVLYMMADKLDWTATLGQVYVNQSEDVIASVQRLRREAYSVGNLTTTPEEQVVDTGDYIEIWPEQAQYICVPIYDPSLIYFGNGLRSGIRFGPKLPIGAWLDFDFDWAHRHVIYHGWGGGAGWIARSRPFIHMDTVYVNDNLRNHQPNPAVLTRTVNYSSLNRYNSVHRDANYDNVRAGGHTVALPPPAPNPPPASNRPVNNKILERNVNANDSRLDQFRGYTDQQPVNDNPAANAPVITRTQPVREQPSRPVQNDPTPQPVARPERSVQPAFVENRSAFNPGAASDRGQASRVEMARPVAAPAPRPEPVRAEPAPRPEPARSEPARPEPARAEPEKPSSPPAGRGGRG
jgi:hypothetical protein